MASGRHKCVRNPLGREGPPPPGYVEWGCGTDGCADEPRAPDLLEIALARAAEALDALPPGAPDADLLEAVAPLQSHLRGLSTAVAADSRSAWGRAVQCLINHPTYLEIIHRHMPRIIAALESRKATVDKENHT